MDFRPELIPHLLPICAMHSITPCRCKWWWPEGNLETNRFHQDWLFVWSSDCPRSKLRTHLRALTWSGSRRTQPCEAPALQGMLQPQWYSEGSYVLAKLQRMLACYSWCLYSQASQNCPDKFNKSTAYILHNRIGNPLHGSSIHSTHLLTLVYVSDSISPARYTISRKPVFGMAVNKGFPCLEDHPMTHIRGY